jgi:DNA-binding response OmpR family regulator
MANGHMKHLLLIDDDTRFLLLMGDFLEERGYQLSRAANGKQGIEVLGRLARESRPPDLIVCDVMMPQMDGYEFVRTLRATPGREVLPVIFLSAKGEVNDRIKGLKEGGDAYLVKPFEPDELVALTEALLRRSEHVQTSGSGLDGWRNLGEPAIAIQCGTWSFQQRDRERNGRLSADRRKPCQQYAAKNHADEPD